MERKYKIVSQLTDHLDLVELHEEKGGGVRRRRGILVGHKERPQTMGTGGLDPNDLHVFGTDPIMPDKTSTEARR